MRQIVLDTETTGLEPSKGHKIIEIGCVEMLNRRITGDTFHVYINPEREIEQDAQDVHGITNEFLKDKPLFADIAAEFIEYIRDSELIIHNAPFDVGFLEHEFRLAKLKPSNIKRYCQVLDTLTMARDMHPGQRNSLDALCNRYHVDNKHREWHGALLDSELLARVYLIMTGGQTTLFDEKEENKQDVNIAHSVNDDQKTYAQTPVIMASSQELEAHNEFLTLLKGDQ
ncbi:MAG: DNA polymerase III subunit epsilon [Legionellaceae bacterium]|nr:DNA polymerase III subunit epsilon [Legionellaceae bacterium]